MFRKKKSRKKTKSRPRTKKITTKKKHIREKKVKEEIQEIPLDRGTELIIACIGVILCMIILGTSVMYHYSSYSGVWVIEPFFIENKTYHDMNVFRVFPRNDGKRYFLYGEYDPIPTDNVTLIVLNQERIVIEGTRTFRYSGRPLNIWIEVERMYPYSLCLDENGTLENLPYIGDLPK